jgi:L-threonylcarbamoyladenylate synthase
MIRLVIDPDRPDPVTIERAADVLRNGGVAAIPTDTLYGLAVDPFNERAVLRIYAIKGRSADRALPLVAAGAAEVRERLGNLSPIGQHLADRFWPGPLTLVIHAPPTLPAVAVGPGGTVAVRVPGHAAARALCLAAGGVLTATSANVSGARPTADPDQVVASLGDAIDVLVDAGITAGGAASTIVDVTTASPRLIRAGAVSWDEVSACLLRE